MAFLAGVPRYEGLQVSRDLYLTHNIDAINDVIFKKHQHDPLDEVRSAFESTHNKLLGLIKPLTDDDLQKPYVHYLPDEPGEGEGPTAMVVICNNTTYHYQEHQEWIEDMLNAG